MTWASRRRLLIVFILVVAVGGISFWHFSPVLLKAPTCTDGKQDGDELGVDCGGTMCTDMCSSQITLPTVLWYRSFPVTDTVYNAAASIQNTNNAGTRAIPYEFKIYDKNNILLARRDGVALIPPLGNYVIVETGIQVGTTPVGSTAFTFSSTPVVWERIPDAVSRLRVTSSNTAFDTTGVVPRLSAMLTNASPTATLNNTSVSAVLYDANDNAVNVSKTVIPTLGPGASANAVFTWPQTLPSSVVRFDIIPVIDVFHANP